MEQIKIFCCGATKKNGKPCYQSERQENVRRHIQNVHEKILEKCECGLLMKQTSLPRHKKYTCRLKTPAQAEIDTNLLNIEPAVIATSAEDEIENVTTFSIQTEVKLVTYKDGRSVLLHDEIKVGNLSFKLTAENGKID